MGASAITERVAIPEELALEEWDVLAVGRRQAWPFVTFAAPTDEHGERTLWIDTDFAVADASGRDLEGDSSREIGTARGPCPRPA